MKRVPIDNNSEKGYIEKDGQYRDKYLVRRDASVDEEGNKYVDINGERRYIKDLVSKHFGIAAEKKEAPVTVTPITEAGDKPKSEDSETKIVQDSKEEEQEEKEESESEDQSEVEPEEQSDETAEKSDEAETTDSAPSETESEIQMIVEIFQAAKDEEEKTPTYATVMAEMHQKGYKVQRNQIAEAKRRVYGD